MSHISEWLKERRAIHADGWGGTWAWSLNADDKTTLSVTGGHVDFDLIHNDEFRGSTEDLEAMSDAHNNLPALLTAVEKVLEAHKPREVSFFSSARMTGAEKECTACNREWPCATVRAIEGVE